ncbi:hypothetical protein MNB_SM-4-1271 [hydrothermal vent metagenome]|uniref:Uncharacterized protein n=1 Tax=hydrothermal vent metagenome TaxID=652676 RepID=A0A1W1CMH7_9ZZZZ
MLVFSFMMIGLVVYFFKKSAQLKLFTASTMYSYRDVIMTRRITSVFVSIMFFMIIFMTSTLLSEWFTHYILLVFFEDAHYLQTLSSFEYYLAEILDFIVFFIILVTLTYTLFKKFYTKIDLTKEHLNIIGTTLLQLDKKEILEIKKVSWSVSKTLHICGVSLLFLKPTVMVRHTKGTCYLRVNKAQELAEDLNKWLSAS